MGLFSKKEKVPQVPEAPKFPEMSPSITEKKDLPELPSIKESLPSPPNQIQPSTSIIPNIPIPGKEEAINAREVPLASESRPEPKIPSPPVKVVEVPKQNPAIVQAAPAKTNEPIFIRMDKFESAQEDFESIKEKIEDIEDALKKIKEIKSKENEEISAWASEIENIKSKFSKIDSEIFDQV